MARNKFPLDLSKFKKTHEDDQFATLTHADGHSLRLAKSMLSPERQEQLTELKMASGGRVKGIDDPNYPAMSKQNQTGTYAPYSNETKDKETEDFGSSMSQGHDVRKKLFNGGKVKGEPEVAEPTSTDRPPNEPSMRQVREDKPSPKKEAEGGAISMPQMYAEGDEVMPADQDHLPMPWAQGQAPAQTAPQAPGVPDLQLSGQGGGLAVPELAQTPQAATPQGQEQVAQAEATQPSPQPPQASLSAEPSLQNAMGLEMQGLKQQAGALQQQGQAQVQAALDRKKQEEMPITGQQALMKHLVGLQKEMEHAHEEWQKNPEINAGRFLANRSTPTKIANAIGLLLGGVSSGTLGGPNPAVVAIQSNIDRDIDEQKANLSNKQSLFNAYNHILGNQKDATAMAGAIMANKYAADMQMAAAKAQSPLAQAALLKGAGELQMRYMPAMQQAAVRQTLMSIRNSGAPVNMDPAQLVQYAIPAEHQKQAFSEIDRAKDTRNMGGSILTAFDNAAKDARIMSGGNPKNLIPGVTSVHVKALHQAMQPTFKDLEGTVRQAAMDNTFHNVTPQAFDSDATVAAKREALQQYLKSKSSSATFEGITGVPLDRFMSTSEAQSQAPITKTMGGVPYKKVNGGWQKVQ